ncbi:hypothetical protein [Rhodococcus sp. IEGM 1305]|uniref:DODA-type extradiol aromatic ring-opening family dioxygenase n=1 Tax=Rhodococcus sp. IEGM 1305 TaxID=3047092 RepID=UPI0024B84EDB|nr:hypothetical protein [Rhodococcus sp. IEGM 1305]MDI9949240.1 hypothetical protein [Rhodococcus sp. IEGM 1305]
MAYIVGGAGVSHSPQLSIEPGGWRAHGDLEQPHLKELNLPSSPRTPEELAREIEFRQMEARHQACQEALERTRDELLEMKPDVLLVVGDDQRELFLDDIMPAVAIFRGESLDDRPPGMEVYPKTMESAYEYYHAGEEETYRTVPELGQHLVEHLVENGFDIAQFSEQPTGRSLGHAFTFIYRRLFEGLPRLPLAPIMLNTYYPPNQPTPRRCVELGQGLRAAIESWDSDLRVALIASGGLTHPIIDEGLDRGLLSALERHDHEALAQIPVAGLTEGSSEIRNWIVVGAALEDATAKVVDYIPAYRSTVGSGCGMGFLTWTRSL